MVLLVGSWQILYVVLRTEALNLFTTFFFKMNLCDKYVPSAISSERVKYCSNGWTNVKNERIRNVLKEIPMIKGHLFSHK